MNGHFKKKKKEGGYFFGQIFERKKKENWGFQNAKEEIKKQ